MHDMSMHDTSMQEMPHEMSMHGMYGPYPMTRESSGTAWQPDSSPQEGLHFMRDDWMFMVHGFANVIYDYQSGDRGDEKVFSESMLMLMAQRQLGPGTLGFRSMLSLDPLMGRSGYPLLFQTGETANNKTPLIDRQHPHDLFMELAMSYSLTLTPDSSVFGYLGYPGEPALGPPTFMHRFSGMDNPEAPLTHHWLDSTHITFGVATVGYVWRNIKLEGSVFTGREPDENRYDFDPPKFDSQSVRLSYNPTEDWAFQISYGRLNSPEQIEPNVDQNRTTASVMYNKNLGDRNNWQTTFAWGRDDNEPGHTLDGFLLESAIIFNHQHTVFGRYEYVAKDELFEPGESLAGRTFRINAASLGYIYDFAETNHLAVGIGIVGSLYFIPGELQSTYGDLPWSSMVFLRVKL